MEKLTVARTEKEIAYRSIDRRAPEILSALQQSPIYEKYAHVTARPAQVGERINTVLNDGLLETVNTAQRGDYVVTNPHGEEYVVPAGKFLEKYAPTEVEGTYQSYGYCRAIENPYNTPIEILSSWGETMRGDETCYIADSCDATGASEGEPYLIASDSFATTYREKPQLAA